VGFQIRPADLAAAQAVGVTIAGGLGGGEQLLQGMGLNCGGGIPHRIFENRGSVTFSLLL
jgi:hypothetical protein